MILNRTATLRGKPAGDDLGIVTGEALLGANFVTELLAGIRDIVGDYSGAYEKQRRKARDIALADLEQAARGLGADAVIGIDLDYETLGQGGRMSMLVASGKAIRF